MKKAIILIMLVVATSLSVFSQSVKKINAEREREISQVEKEYKGTVYNQLRADKLAEINAKYDSLVRQKTVVDIEEKNSSIERTTALKANQQKNTLIVDKMDWDVSVEKKRESLDLMVMEKTIERRFETKSQENKKVLGYVSFSISDPYVGSNLKREAKAFYKVFMVDQKNQMIPGSMIYEGELRVGEKKWIELEAGANYLVTITYRNRSGKKRITPMSDNPTGIDQGISYFWATDLNIYQLSSWNKSNEDVWPKF